jgi:hypothetical protein
MVLDRVPKIIVRKSKINFLKNKEDWQKMVHTKEQAPV